MTWNHTVSAYNTATDSTNRMHDDNVARSFGFRGGLVPGVDAWAYLTRPCVDRWGTEFLTGGAMAARFRQPVYDGELMTATLTDQGGLTLLGPDGVARVTGTASVGGSPQPSSVERAPCPAAVPDASAENLAAGTVLGTLEFDYRHELAAPYLSDIRDTSDLYGDGAIAHPGFLARQANHVLSRNVVLGPWIHVETTASHCGLVQDGDAIEVRGVVVDEREHKGHRFVDLDVEIRANDQTVWTARHTAIWRPAGAK